MQTRLKTDVLIVGGGVTGVSVARELSKYKVDVTLAEKGSDVGSGITKTSHGLVFLGAVEAFSLILKSIMTPGAPIYDQTSPKLAVQTDGFWESDRLFHELDVPHKHLIALVVARNDEELNTLKTMQEICELMGAKVRLIDREALVAIEPNVTDEAFAALYDDAHLMEIFPPDYVIALAENAQENGVRLMIESPAQRISRVDGNYIVETPGASIEAKFIVNAAGKYSDAVADMAGARDDWDLVFNRSEMMLLDRRVHDLVNTCLMAAPKPGEFNMLLPLGPGNIYVGCGKYMSITDREYISTTRTGLRRAVTEAKRLVPRFSERDIIASFVGVRVWNSRDPGEHILEASRSAPNFINLVIRLPGITPAPAVAKKVVGILGDQGLPLTKKDDFNPFRKGIPVFRELSNSERDSLIAKDPRYGHVVCRCETVTEGEIVEAISRGARTVQEVKFRARAGMGRCQAGFCGPRVVQILSRELNIPVTEVTYKGGNSKILHYRAKQLLEGVR